tara:strand:+ start:1200 stop:2528 length:1329 start_codon:yes stop_codon:yes gene_type:complete
MSFQNLNKNLNLYIFIVIFFTILLFLIGFFFQENSAGAGSFKGDFKHVWNNLTLFKDNNFWEGLKATAGIGELKYKSSRTPLIYILNAYLNPFAESRDGYILSIFFFSIFTYCLFYFSLREKYKDKIHSSFIIFLSCIILLSPYFRTSSYWGLEENFGILAIFISFIFFKKIEDKNKGANNFNIFLLALFSSLCVYFDHKLVIIPFYFLFNLLIGNNISLKKKFNLGMFYLFFSIPFLYLIYLWENIIPVGDAEVRGTLQKIYFENIGFSLTIIAFYLFPFLFLKKENLFYVLKNKIKSLNIYIFFIFLVIYILILINFNPLEREFLGNGIVYKFSIIIFDNFELSKILLYLSFFVSALIIYLYIDNIKDYVFVFYLVLSSILVTPLLQEYFDPLMLILILLFFNTKIYLNFSKLLFVYSYFLIFLLIANLHYSFDIFSYFS